MIRYLFALLLLMPVSLAATPVARWKDLAGLSLRTGKPSPSLAKLLNKPVRVAGFMIPLEDSEAVVNEFLLVPYPLACVHVPAPPANQIVHVKMANNRKIPVQWYEPIYVEGLLRAQKMQSIYADSSFQMSGFRVYPYNGEGELE
jgi:hypothetical protein